MVSPELVDAKASPAGTVPEAEVPAQRIGLGRAFHQLGAVWTRAIGERLVAARWPAEAGFRPGCVGVMLCLQRIAPASQREISAEVDLDPSDVVGVVDILEAAGLVERRRDPADRRRYAVALTALGRRRARQLRALVAELQAELLAPLEEDERETLVTLLDKLRQHHRPTAEA
jgi:DNA-binding MarR family transcriptional regulator